MPRQAEKIKTVIERSVKMFCANCGKELDEDYTFCPNCGTARQSNETPSPNITQKNTESITINKSLLKKGIVILLMVVILTSVCVAFLFRGVDKNATGVHSMGSNSVNTVKTAEIVGKWQEKETPSVYLTLNKDNTGEMSSGGWAIKLNWTYSKKTNAVTMEINGMGSSTAIYDPINDTISRDGVVFVRVS